LQPWQQALAFSAGFAVVAALLWAVSYRGPAFRKPPSSSLVLHYTRSKRVGAWVILYIANFVGAWIVMVVLGQPSPPWEWLFAPVLAFAITGWLFVEVHRAHMTLDDDRVVYRRAWGTTVICPWSDIANVRYNDTFYWLVFTTKKGKRFRVSRAIGNFGALLQKVRTHVPRRQFGDSQTFSLIVTDPGHKH
jgi:hypothetical protein